MKAVGVAYFAKPSRDKNIDYCQEIGVKFERTFLKFTTVDSISETEGKNQRLVNFCGKASHD